MVKNSNNDYIPEFDAFRGVAVILVLLIHWGITGAGWIGVQAFFVLSGYLITRNLTIDRGLNRIILLSYLKRFYLKRLFRLAPIYYLYIAGFVLFNVFYLDLNTNFAIVLSSLTYSINFYALTANSELLDGIGHFWSLAVEEQFYLIWPFVCYFLSKKKLRVLLYFIIIIGPCLRFAIFQTAFYIKQDLIYSGQAVYLLPFGQIDSFAIGALLTVVNQKPNNNIIRYFWSFIFVFIIVALLNFYLEDQFNNFKQRALSFGFPHLMINNFQYVWGYSLLNILFGFFIYMIVIGENQIILFKSQILQSIGKISYGIYIFHVPILAFLKKYSFQTFSLYGIGMLIIYFSFTILVAFFSFRYIEKPMIRLKNKL